MSIKVIEGHATGKNKDLDTMIQELAELYCNEYKLPFQTFGLIYGAIEATYKEKLQETNKNEKLIYVATKYVLACHFNRNEIFTCEDIATMTSFGIAQADAIVSGIIGNMDKIINCDIKL